MAEAIVAVGTNQPWNGLAGPALVAAALQRLEEQGFALLSASICHATVAWPDPADPPFTNAVAVLHAGARDAQAVLEALLQVEAAFGRVRGARNAPRTLDLDLLDFGGAVIERPGLVLPHPRLHLRRFVLTPLAEAAPGWRHPVLGLTAGEMLTRLP